MKNKKFSMFQIVSFVLIVGLIIAIIVQASIIVSLKNKINDTKEKNKEIDQSTVLMIDSNFNTIEL